MSYGYGTRPMSVFHDLGLIPEGITYREAVAVAFERAGDSLAADLWSVRHVRVDSPTLWRVVESPPPWSRLLTTRQVRRRA
jgi:hypothetical protein